MGHIVPEAQEGGPLALVQNGDMITIDVENTLSVALSEDELAKETSLDQAPLQISKKECFTNTLKVSLSV